METLQSCTKPSTSWSKYWKYLTHWPIREVTVIIFRMLSPNICYKLISWALLKLFSTECHRMNDCDNKSMLVQVMAWCVRQQAIIGANTDPDLFNCTVETLYSTIYYSKYFIELNFDKSTEYVALWTHKRHPIPRPFGRTMECLLWVLQQKLTVL